MKRAWSIERYCVSRVFPTTMKINKSFFHRRVLFITLFRGRLQNSRYENAEIFAPLRRNVITEFAQEIVYVEDDQRLFGKRGTRFRV